MSNWILITFGDGSAGWRQAAKRLKFQANRTGLFHAVETLNNDWLENFDPQVRTIQKQMLEKSPRGHGYYVWKPSVLWYADLLFPEHHICYVDAGSDIRNNQFALQNFRILLNLAESTGYSFQLGAHPEKHWSKRRVREYLVMSQDELESNQIQSGFICLPANRNRSQFIHDWRNAAVFEDGILFNDVLDDNEDSGLVEHRHDQSVFSVLWKREKYGFGPDISDPANLANTHNAAIVAGRNPTWLPLHAFWFVRAGAIKINIGIDTVNETLRKILNLISYLKRRLALWKTS